MERESRRIYESTKMFWEKTKTKVIWNAAKVTATQSGSKGKVTGKSTAGLDVLHVIVII